MKKALNEEPLFNKLGAYKAKQSSFFEGSWNPALIAALSAALNFTVVA